uniref:Guanylate cyclase n=1 Tax=Caenorhabditis japonica TaxID=281687 RepID=A0A8R1DJA3_CAEJA
MNPIIISPFQIVTDVITKFYPTSSGRLPDSDPECGFRGENCDYTKEIVLACAIVCIVLLIIIIIWMRRACETRALEKMPWRVFRDDVQLLDEEQAKSVISINSASTKMSQVETKLIKNHAIVGVNTHAVYDFYEQRQIIRFNRADMVLLTKMKQAVHDNINPFIGISFNEKSELLLLWKFCSRGTLQDVIYSDKFQMDDKFQGAFVRDITMGLEYLHSCQIGYHGCLSTWSALIDKNWMIKLTDYAVCDSLKRWEKHGSINCRVDNESEQKWQKLASLYVPPEIRTVNEKNRMRRMDKKWQDLTVVKWQHADIYAFGVVIYEILFRSLPYDERMDLTGIKGNLVDSMMRMMEEYANNLEKLVGERTKMAEEANLRAERLLFQLLPKNIAVELKAGKTVEPKQYNSATVMFSDIAGFTKLCSQSTPIEVVTLLNKLYSEFDTVINRHDSYKVETIGDAYMVVSGVPMENGQRHVANIASVTLDIVELLKDFEVPHRRNYRLTIRLGFASGAVAAGVVGLNSPRYCLFGDTVNIASIMESTGEGGRIQITEISKSLLAKEYPEFMIEVRGINKEVNHDDFCTFWLTGKDEEYFQKNFD